MPKLPKYGWFHKCEGCDQATSRFIIIYHGKRTFYKYSCIRCRRSFIHWLFSRFNHVIILDETSTYLSLKV